MKLYYDGQTFFFLGSEVNETVGNGTLKILDPVPVKLFVFVDYATGGNGT